MIYPTITIMTINTHIMMSIFKKINVIMVTEKE